MLIILVMASLKTFDVLGSVKSLIDSNVRCLFDNCIIVFSSASCQFPSGALTGNLNVDHAMCVLSLNIINDKIFLIEWFWFFALAFISMLATILTSLVVACPKVRRLIIR